MIQINIGTHSLYVYLANYSDTVGTVLPFVIKAVCVELVVSKIEKR